MKLYTLIFFLAGTILSANNRNLEIDKLIEQSSTKTQNKTIQPISFKTDSNKTIKIEFSKKLTQKESEDRNGRAIFALQDITAYISFNKNSRTHFYKEESTVYGQNIDTALCFTKENNAILSIVLSYANTQSALGWFVQFAPKLYEFNLSSEKNIREIGSLYNNILSLGVNYSDNIIIDDPDINHSIYSYYNEEKILERLYETGTCDKETTQKANIEVLLADGRWIPQEQSWNIKDEISNNINSSSQNPSINLKQLLESSKSNQKVSIENINEVLKNEPLTTKNVQKYNDTAYYLQQANANDEAIFLLEKIIEKFPNRTVAYLNLADAYAGKNESEKAKVNYEKYIALMKEEGKEAKIPKRVLEYK